MYYLLQSKKVKAYLQLFRRLFLTALVVYLLFFAAPVIMGKVRPFLFAFVLAFLLNPLINRIQKKTKISRGALSIILVLTVVILLVASIGGLIYAIISEVISLAVNINNTFSQIEDCKVKLSKFKSSVSEKESDLQSTIQSVCESNIFSSLSLWMFVYCFISLVVGGCEDDAALIEEYFHFDFFLIIFSAISLLFLSTGWYWGIKKNFICNNSKNERIKRNWRIAENKDRRSFGYKQD